MHKEQQQNGADKQQRRKALNLRGIIALVGIATGVWRVTREKVLGCCSIDKLIGHVQTQKKHKTGSSGHTGAWTEAINLELKHWNLYLEIVCESRNNGHRVLRAL